MIAPKFSKDAFFELSDDQWTRLTTIVGLPDSARKSFEVAISIFRWSSAVVEGEVSPRQAKDSLRRASAGASKTANLLEELGGSEIKALYGSRSAVEMDCTFQNIIDEMADHIERLNFIAAWCEDAASGIHSKQPGADASGLRYFVRRVDRLVLKHTGEGFKSSTKRTDRGLLLEALLAISDFKASPDSIYAATKDAVSNR